MDRISSFKRAVAVVGSLLAAPWALAQGVTANADRAGKDIARIAQAGLGRAQAGDPGFGGGSPATGQATPGRRATTAVANGARRR